jgi:hypothetical protein
VLVQVITVLGITAQQQQVLQRLVRVLVVVTVEQAQAQVQLQAPNP